MHEGAAWAVSQNALAARNAADESHVEEFIDDALALAGDTPHGLSARVQYCLYGAQTIFASDHRHALPEVPR
jgi:hypothetical protein